MLDKIIHFSINNKFIIGLFTLVLVIVGSYSLYTLPIDALPDITNNQVQIITSSPTLATQEVEQFITYPIEQSVKSIPDIVELRSISRFGLSVVTVVFKEEVNYSRIVNNADVYISPKGDDLTGDGTIDNPWKTLKKVPESKSRFSLL